MNEVRLTQGTIMLSLWCPDTLVASGVLVDDHPTNPRLKAGTSVTTSKVLVVAGAVILTESGTRYRLV